jgi:tetratricopeptide (TPR) repeat protein
MNKLLIITLLLFCSSVLHAQTDKQHVRKGNKLYKRENFEQAAEAYRNALEKNPLNEKATFNLGNTLFRQNNFEGALRHFNSTAEMTRDRNREAHALYNAGNSLIKAEKYGESIPYYQKALRINPNDDDARYNLAYALRMLQQQNNQNNQDQKNQNKDNQNKENRQDNQQQGENDQQQNADNNKQQNADNNQQQPKNRQPQLSKEEAERLMQALTNEEKKTIDKVNQQKFKTGQRTTREKEW